MSFTNISYSLSRTQESSRTTLLVKTYLLLSLTLSFSAGSAAFAVYHHAGTSALILMLVAFGLLFATRALSHSRWGILLVFGFTGCMGYAMGPLLSTVIHGYSNGSQLIMTALGGTGITFFVLSSIIIITKKNLSGWSTLLTTGIMVCLIASLANIFLKMPALQLTVSSLLTFISAMLIMYDTSRIINNGEDSYLMATIALYIDIQMLFQNLLMLLMSFSGRD